MLLRRWYELMIEHNEDLALIMTREQDKPLSEAHGEIDYAASYIGWFAEETRRVYGETIPSPWDSARLLVLRQPIGVAAAIMPWNFPAAMITRKAAPELGASCTIVVKPASQTPLTALTGNSTELPHRTGLPPGVFNVVIGSAADIGGELTSNPKVRKLSFTGSTEIGSQWMSESQLP